MKRSAMIFSGVLVASLLVGCSSQQQNNDPQAQQHQTGMLQGSVDPSMSKADPFLTEKDPPVNAATHFAAGQYAEAEANYTLAVQQYTEACKAQPDYLMAEYRLGVCYAHLKIWP